MSTLYVTEYQHATVDQGRALPVGHGRPLASQIVAIGGGSLASAPFNALTHLIRVHCDSTCSIAINNPGGTDQATTSTARLAANQTEYFGVDPGGTIAVIFNS